MQGIERKIEKQDNGSGQVQCVFTLQNRRKSPQKISVGMSMPGMVFCSTPLNLSSS